MSLLHVQVSNIYHIWYLYLLEILLLSDYMRSNIMRIIQDPISLIRWSFVVLCMSLLQYRQFDFQLVVWNLWLAFAWAEIILYVVTTVLFALFVMAQTYKIRCFGRWQKKKTTGWLLGWIIGIVTVGCPACSITIASFVGLSWLIALLPFEWLELKVLAIVLLLRANYMLLKDLMICKNTINSPKKI